MRRSFLLLGFIVAMLAANVSFGGDWPQILGPNRDGAGHDESLASSWPAAGPKTVWQREVGSGFSGIVVAGGKAVLFHRLGDQEFVEAMDAKTGKVLWKTGSPTSYQASINPDDGPRATPVIHKGRVYVYGAQGALVCLDMQTGKKLWSRQTHKDYGAREGYFGAGSSPIIEGDNIIVNVGGRQPKTSIVAFALDTGKTSWSAVSDGPSYSSPIAATVGGLRHLIFVTRLNAVSLDPKTGNVRFQFPFGQRGPTVNGASPLVVDGHLFLSASYGIGAVFAKIDKTKAREVWASDDIMSSQYTTCVAHNGNLYGIDGRQDQGRARLKCFNPKTRKEHWSKAGFGYATLVQADGKLIALKTDGDLTLARLTPDKYEELAAASIFNSTTRALPALANGYLYARDTRVLKCLALGK